MTKNQAAWITHPRAKPLKVDEAPEWKAGPGEVVIKNAALAINPVEWKIQDSALLPVSYPAILGEDVAGVIEEVGDGVTRLKKGQRVMAYCHSIGSQNMANGGFQLYSLVPEILVSPIPDSLSFEQAVVIPSALSTAAAGLYEDTTLALPYPVLDGSRSNNGTILIWGAASSVGGSAVQLACASGLQVIATASAHNHDLVKSLGASSVFDYKSPSVVQDLIAAIKNAGDFVGVFDAVSVPDTITKVGSILHELGPRKVAFVMPSPEVLPDNVQPVMTLSFNIAAPPHDVVGDALWRKYVPEALARGLLQAKPDPVVIGSGLGKIQEGIDRLKAGVSAQKIVVTL
ncbi:hypothetical protein SLS56_008615 [Neofusicoccum ribis]|uniref:Enoyl reductase (ER) domain-containing protein n=1 Tax=Neofusicoccum ribis TaxID=45134 RepID=A0ABR3SJM5_9PEZI